MKLAFLTDMHLGAEGENRQGVDVRHNFLKALDFVADMKPNGLILGGDICNSTGDRAVYEWVKKQVDQLPMPCYVIPGNHDDSIMLAEVFQNTHYLHGRDLYYALPLEGRPVLFLDSSKGELSAEQWNWLQNYLKALRNNNVLIIMHHPPLPADVVFMDRKYPFGQSDAFLDLARDLPCHITVVCGHYHVDKVVQRGNLLVLLSPSTYYQMQQSTPEFAIDHYRVGIREINLTTHGTTSTVHYLEPGQ
jgi:Icc protein